MIAYNFLIDQIIWNSLQEKVRAKGEYALCFFLPVRDSIDIEEFDIFVKHTAKIIRADDFDNWLSKLWACAEQRGRVYKLDVCDFEGGVSVRCNSF